MIDTKIEQGIDEAIEDMLNSKLILWNDDYNPIDMVVELLTRICNHSLTQAEQCALIAHAKGSCQVSSGSFDEMYVMKSQLNDSGLEATVE